MAQERVVFSPQQISVLIEHVRIVERALKEFHELKLLEYCILRALHLSGKAVTQTDLVIFLGAAKSTVTERLLSLEDRALIMKTNDADDRRRMIISLTKLGSELSEKATQDLFTLLKNTFWRTLSNAELFEIQKSANRDHNYMIGLKPDSLEIQNYGTTTLTASFFLCIIYIIKGWTELIKLESALSLSEFRILAALYDANSAMRLVDLSTTLIIEKSNITKYSKSLTTQQFVTINKSEKDARSCTLMLSDKGQKLVERLSLLLNDKNKHLYFTNEEESNLLNAWHMRMYCELGKIRSKSLREHLGQTLSA